MAARYWVGGTGNWSDATTHWSDASGGTPGASFLPTSADDVYIDANSFSAIGTITITGIVSVNNFDATDLGYAVNLYQSSNGYVFNLYGSLTISPNLNISFTGTNCRFVLCGTGLHAITSNGKSVIIYGVSVNGVGGKYKLMDDFTNAAPYSFLILYNGEFDINGYTYTGGSVQIGHGIKTLTYGSGTIIGYQFLNQNNGGLTLNYDTGTTTLNKGGILTMVGPWEFYDLNIQPQPTVNQSCYFQISNSITVYNNLNIAGQDETINRAFIRSEQSIQGTLITITAESVTVKNADFMDIKGAGNADWDLSAITGGSGNGGGNQDIIFTTPKSCYWYSGSGNWSDTTKWRSATNGGGVSGLFPLIQDTAIFDTTSFSDGDTLTINCRQLPHFDARLCVNYVNISNNNNYLQYNWFGSIYLSNTFSLVGQRTSYLFGVGSCEWDAGENVFDNVYIYMAHGEMTLVNNLFANVINIRQSDLLDFSGWDVTAAAIHAYNSGLIRFGNGTTRLYGLNSTILTISATVSVQCGTGTIWINPNTGGVVDLQLTISGNRVLNNVTFSCSEDRSLYLNYSGVLSVSTLTIGEGQTVRFRPSYNFRLSDLIAEGTLERPITITSHNLPVGGVYTHNLLNTSYQDIEVNHCSISLSVVTGTPKLKIMDKTYLETLKVLQTAKASIYKVFGVRIKSSWIANNSTDEGNNSGWIFE